jgi:hypothetical protein
VVQRITPNVQTGEQLVNKADDFRNALELELVEERAFAPLYVIRLSRIKAIDEAKLLDWAKHRKELPATSKSSPPALTPTENEHLLLWLRQLP